tara:strand:- start:202 stop:564 length:363 start_codon:yes stop_codon:yes gene_type:complete
MLGNLEPEERVMEGSILDQIAVAANKLGWEVGEDITVEIGGMSISGIDVGEEYNKKWQSPLGTRKYNKDAFIIIKNQSRRDLTKSVPNPELKAHHLKTEKELAAELKREDDAKMYDTYSK